MSTHIGIRSERKSCRSRLLFYTELFMVREERQRYEEACKEWQQKCVEVELVAVKDSKYFGDVIPISRNRGR